jgi:transaldolase/glucose-6-phosphate isomerase
MRAQCYAASGGLDADRGEAVQTQGRSVPAARNPGLTLGAVLGESALQGRDKLTILADAPLMAFAGWIEQIIAESSGKDGKGILPVPLEPLGDAGVYGNDRLFVYLNQTGGLVDTVKTLQAAGHPAIQIPIPDIYEIGAEMYRWEVATAIACSILGVNAFDQPNVESSKKITKARIADYQKSGMLDEGKPAWQGNGFLVYSSSAIAGSSLTDVLKEFLSNNTDANGYVAINAYLPRREEMIDALQKLRVAIRTRTGNAVTAGFGPRFQHSTGQFHKGGLDNGAFLVITTEPEADFDIPNQGLTFGTLIRAQALGDYEALVESGRKVLRLHLLSPGDIEQVVAALN